MNRRAIKAPLIGQESLQMSLFLEVALISELLETQLWMKSVVTTSLLTMG